MSSVRSAAVTLVGGPCHGQTHDVHIWPYRVDSQYFPSPSPGAYVPDESDPSLARWDASA